MIDARLQKRVARVHGMNQQRRVEETGCHMATQNPEGRDGVENRSLLNLPTPCVLLDRNGRIEFANSAWATSHGRLVPLAPAGRNLADALEHVPAGGMAAEGIREVVAGRRADFTCDVCTDAQANGWLRLFCSRVSGETSVVLLVDVTDHPSAHARDESELRLKRIVEAAMDGIITIDEHERVVMFNAAAERVFGVSAAEAMGAPISRFIPARFRANHGAHIREFGQTGVSSRGMGRLGTLSGLRADGSEFAMEASISAAAIGAKRYYTVILRDVSERLRMETQYLHAQKMEGVGRLAGGIAHDFNNLLMAIFNYLTLAARRVGEEHPARAAIGHAQQAAERAAGLTRQLLTFARKQPTNLRVLNPSTLLKGLTPMLKGVLGEDVNLRVLTDEGVASVEADQAQVEQVIVNLAINARDAMPGGGSLTIELRDVSLDATYCGARAGVTPGDYVEIAVTDTGSGMSAEVQARLFEPFFTTKPPGKGTGLGLATSHGIVKQVGGHIAVYSEVGRGTSVKVYLPCVRSEGAGEERAATDGSVPRGTETILLVEDSSLVRDLVADELRIAGYEVHAAENGADALALAARDGKRPDLLLTDVVLPGMSGVELAEKLRSTRDLPVILMSGYTEETISHHGVDPARWVFVAKPFLMDSLLRLIRRVLDRGPSAAG
ncbi:MAG: ATP-binding protein [Phycisphaerales bacterium]